MKRIEITETKIRLAQKQLIDTLIGYINEIGDYINNIETNGNIVSSLQEDLSYSLNPTPEEIEKKVFNSFSVGNFNGLILKVNPMQLWTDDKIFLKKDDEIILEIEVVDKEGVLI